MSTATTSRPVMHRLRIQRTDGELSYDSSHDDHYVTAARALASRAQRLRDMRRPFVIDGARLTYADPDGFTYTLTYEDVQP